MIVFRSGLGVKVATLVSVALVATCGTVLAADDDPFVAQFGQDAGYQYSLDKFMVELLLCDGQKLLKNGYMADALHMEKDSYPMEAVPADVAARLKSHAKDIVTNSFQAEFDSGDRKHRRKMCGALQSYGVEEFGVGTMDYNESE